ncbi:MAG: SDR family NAD(P)-dependent oxidoreductase, partial [Candidatus Nanopelagicales bacterium]
MAARPQFNPPARLTHIDDRSDHIMRMKNKVGLVTGAASGLGYESAKLMAEEGAAVLLCDIDTEMG